MRIPFFLPLIIGFLVGGPVVLPARCAFSNHASANSASPRPPSPMGHGFQAGTAQNVEEFTLTADTSSPEGS